MPRAIKLIIFCAALLIATLPSLSRAADDSVPLRIGLFNLLKPEVIEIAPALEGEFTITSGTPDDKELKVFAAQKLHLEIRSDGLRCELRDDFGEQGNQHIIFRRESLPGWRATSLKIAGSGNVIATIPGKLTRQLPAAIEFLPAGETISAIISTSEARAVTIITASELAEIGAVTPAQSSEIYKVLSVVVRSYLRHERGRHRAQGYDLCDNTHCMLYYGEDQLTRTPQAAQITAAAAATADSVLTFRGAVIPGYFTAACGGRTAVPADVWAGKLSAADRAAFHGVSCNYCRNDRFYHWERAVAAALVWAALRPALDFQPDENTELRVGRRSNDGFVISLEIMRAGGHTEISAARFRHLIGMRLGWNIVLSNSFVIRPQGRQFLFRGRGFGHNLGLCLAGAIEQARVGRDYQQILHYYFPATDIRRGEAGVIEKGP